MAEKFQISNFNFNEAFQSRHGIIGFTYHSFRFAQFATLVTVIGLVGKFVAEMNSYNISPPSLLVGIIALVSLAVVYIIILSILFWDHKITTFVWPLIFDSAILAGLIVVAYVAGRPLSYLQCSSISSAASSTAGSFVESLADLTGGGESIYTNFIAASEAVCNDMKAIWGLCIANCVFFSFSVIIGLIIRFLNWEAFENGRESEA